jgi:hypothetical protein
MDAIQFAVGCPHLIKPTNSIFEADCGELFDAVVEAVEAGQ